MRGRKEGKEGKREGEEGKITIKMEACTNR